MVLGNKTGLSRREWFGDESLVLKTLHLIVAVILILFEKIHLT